MPGVIVGGDNLRINTLNQVRNGFDTSRSLSVRRPARVGMLDAFLTGASVFTTTGNIQGLRGDFEKDEINEFMQSANIQRGVDTEGIGALSFTAGYKFEDWIPEDLEEFSSLYAQTEYPHEALMVTAKLRGETRKQKREALQSKIMADRPFSAAAGAIAGQFVDPVNYIPLVNIASKAKTAHSGIKLLNLFRLSEGALSAGKLKLAEKFRQQGNKLLTTLEKGGAFSSKNSFGRGFVDFGAQGLSASALQQIVISNAREDQTFQDSLIDITVDTLTAGTLGGAVELYGVRKYNKIKKVIGEDLKDAFKPFNKKKNKSLTDMSLREALDIPTNIDEVPQGSTVKLYDTVLQKETYTDIEMLPGVKDAEHTKGLLQQYKNTLPVRNVLEKAVKGNDIDPGLITDQHNFSIAVKDGRISIAMDESKLDELANISGMSGDEFKDRIGFINDDLSKLPPTTKTGDVGGVKGKIPLSDKDISKNILSMSSKAVQKNIDNLNDLLTPRKTKVKKEKVKELQLETLANIEPSMIPKDAEFPTEWSFYKLDDTPVTEIMVETDQGLKPLVDIDDLGIAPTGTGIEKLLAKIHFNPNLYMYSRAQSARAKLLFHRLFNTSFKLSRNMDLSASKMNVETAAHVRIGREDLEFNKLINDSWREYVTGRKNNKNNLGIAGRLSAQVKNTLASTENRRIGFREFGEEVIKTVRRRVYNSAYRHEIEQVNRVAEHWTEKFNSILEEGAGTGADLFKEFVEINQDEAWKQSYVPQLWNLTEIAANRELFGKLLEGYLKKKQRFAATDITPEVEEQIQGQVKEIIETLLHENSGELRRVIFDEQKYELPRQLDIQKVVNESELSQFETFMVNDPTKIMNSYMRSVIPDLELSKVLDEAGVKSADDLLLALKIDYERMIAAAKPEKRKAIQNEMETVLTGDKAYLPVLLQKLRGQYARPQSKYWKNISNIAKNWAFSTNLGGVTRSSIPDAARLPFELGFRSMSKPLARIATSFKEVAQNMNDIARISGINEILSNERTLQMANLSDANVPVTSNSQIERFLQQSESISKGVADVSQAASLINHWNQFWKTYVGYNMNDIALQAAFDVSNGKAIDDFLLGKLAENFISTEDLFKIADEFNNGGGVELKGVKFVQIDNWKNKDLAQRYTSMLNRQINKTIVTPNIADRPFLFDHEFMQLFAQFKTFTVATTNAVLISGLQEKQAHMLLAASFQILLGAGSYMAAQMQNRREVTDDPAKLLSEAIDRSGLISILSETNTLLNQIPLVPGLDEIVFEHMLSRNENLTRKNNFIAFGAGAAGTRVVDAQRGLEGLNDVLYTGETSESNIKAFVRSIPLQNNLLFKSVITNPFEDFLIDRFGE